MPYAVVAEAPWRDEALRAKAADLWFLLSSSVVLALHAFNAFSDLNGFCGFNDLYDLNDLNVSSSSTTFKTNQRPPWRL
jgi:hypothetical protein